jgi:hypothetical protein
MFLERLDRRNVILKEYVLVVRCARALLFFPTLPFLLLVLPLTTHRHHLLHHHFHHLLLLPRAAWHATSGAGAPQ